MSHSGLVQVDDGDVAHVLSAHWCELELDMFKNIFSLNANKESFYKLQSALCPIKINKSVTFVSHFEKLPFYSFN